jgi:hypothetical protein
MPGGLSHTRLLLRLVLTGTGTYSGQAIIIRDGSSQIPATAILQCETGTG